jgi:ATP-dependent protease ClpP protease subunit
VVTNAAGAAELWVDDYIEPPSPWGDYGVSARSIREALDEVGARDVVVHMNSGGGDYFEGVAIYQALAQHPGDVYVAVDALAASAASVVAMAGDTIGIGPGAFVMIHEASAFAYGNAADMLRIADMLDAIGDEIAGFYAARGKLDAAGFREAMAKETWYGPAAAIAAGLADEQLAVPATDPNAVDPDEDEDEDDEADDEEEEMDPAVAALFDFARPAAITRTPPAPDPEAEPQPTTTETVDPFSADLTELFA